MVGVVAAAVVSESERSVLLLLIERQTRRRGVCALWGNAHLKNLDGALLSLLPRRRNCRREVFRHVDGDFGVSVECGDATTDARNSCPLVITLVVQETVYTLRRGDFKDYVVHTRWPNLLSTDVHITLNGDQTIEPRIVF